LDQLEDLTDPEVAPMAVSWTVPEVVPMADLMTSSVIFSVMAFGDFFNKIKSTMTRAFDD
jgi:hypothetical protein